MHGYNDNPLILRGIPDGRPILSETNRRAMTSATIVSIRPTLDEILEEATPTRWRMRRRGAILALMVAAFAIGGAVGAIAEQLLSRG
jgi:hypothetical protein